MDADKFFIDSTGNKHKLSLKDKIYWRISGYAVLLTSDNKILMVKPGWSNLWELPGGGIKTTESIFQGIQREVLEETGFKINIESSAPFYIKEDWFYYKRGKNKFNHSLRLVFKAKTLGDQDVGRIDKSEIKKAGFIKLESLDKGNCHQISLPVIKLLKP
jgi:8-oxo-dGTP diphosphatase